jgi:hypothetical protein
MHKYLIIKWEDIGGWGAERREVGCVKATCEHEARIIAFESMSGGAPITLTKWYHRRFNEGPLSVLSHYTVELIA